MGWKIELSGGAGKALKQIDPPSVHRILRFLHDRVGTTGHPRQLGTSLKGSKLGELWRYRIGDCRAIADLQDEVLTVLVIRIGHRRDVYR